MESLMKFSTGLPTSSYHPYIQSLTYNLLFQDILQCHKIPYLHHHFLTFFFNKESKEKKKAIICGYYRNFIMLLRVLIQRLAKFYLMTQILCTTRQDILLDGRVGKLIITIIVITGRWADSKLPLQLGNQQQIMLKLFLYSMLCKDLLFFHS